jgi:hypothetical protein
MKKILIASLIGLFSVSSYAEAEKKKVCHVDEKTKKEVCKTIKVHKKLEGTQVPEKKK